MSVTVNVLLLVRTGVQGVVDQKEAAPVVFQVPPFAIGKIQLTCSVIMILVIVFVI